MNIYEHSEVMSLLGHQYYNAIINAEDMRQIKELLSLYNTPILEDPVMCAADIFVLGYIAGIRAERARRKSRAAARLEDME